MSDAPPIHLTAVLQQYAAALDALDKVSPSLPPKLVLEVLLARNTVEEAVAHQAHHPPEQLLTLFQLDERLKSQGEAIAETVDLAEWRRSLNQPDSAWWWAFQPPERIHPRDQYDFLWQAVAIACLTGSLGLLGELSAKFLAVVPDTFGTVSLTLQGVLTALAGGGALTRVGQETTERILTRVGIPRHYWHEVTAGFSTLVLLMLLGFRLALPQIAAHYSRSGTEALQQGNTTSAELDYQRALRLDPTNADANYWLGRLYDDLNNPAKAQEQYQIAAQAGVMAAYDPLAQLYIQKGDLDTAVSLLLRGIEQTDDPLHLYSLYTNLGWARLRQGRYAEAEAALQEAAQRAIAANLNAQSTEAAYLYCLQAQVQDALGNSNAALQQWNQCLQTASSTIPAQDRWINQGQQRMSGISPEPVAPSPVPVSPAPTYQDSDDD